MSCTLGEGKGLVKYVWWFLLTTLIVVCFARPVAGADWTSEPPHVHDRAAITVPDRPYCATPLLIIVIQGQGQREACVMSGKHMDIASYYGSDYRPRLAVRHFSESTYSGLRGICEAVWGCLYVGGTDTLVEIRPAGLARYAYVHARASSLIRYEIDTSTGLLEASFTPDGRSPLRDVVGRPLPVGTVAVSREGRWLLVEVRNVGLVRVDLQTSELRHIALPQGMYGVGRDPSVQAVISEDGRVVVSMGENVGLAIMTVDAHCGVAIRVDAPLLDRSSSCPEAPLDPQSFAPRFRIGVDPWIDASGGELRFTAGSYGGIVERVILRAADYNEQYERDYLALGDSFTSGEGETDRGWYRREKGNCQVSRRSYPYLLAQLLQFSMLKTENAACAGARMTEIFQSERGRQRQFEPLLTAKMITVGIGGNDAGFMTKLRACAAPTVCEWTLPERRYDTALEIQRLYPELARLYARLRAEAPSSRVYAVGYPRIAEPTEPCIDPVVAVLSREERQFMIEGVAYLNRVIKAAAGAAGITYLDVEEAYAGRSLCGLYPRAINGLRLGSDIAPVSVLPRLKLISSGSFHPTPLGHRYVAAAIASQWPGLGEPAPCSCVPAVVPDPEEYWGARRQESARQLALPFANASVGPGESFDVSVPEGVLKVGTTARVVIHSSPIELGATTVGEGVLSLSAQLPAGIESGYHTLHVFAESITGHALDIYQEVLVLEGATRSTTDNSEELEAAEALVSVTGPSERDSVPKPSVLGKTVPPASAGGMKQANTLLVVGALLVGLGILILIARRVLSRYPGG